MPEIIETTVYRLGELSDDAKERARSWFREGIGDWDWYDFIYDDFDAICRILGIELRTTPVRLYGGGTRDKPCIWFSGFSSQGDGACFEGGYRYQPGALKALRDYAPKDTELHRIAGALQKAQRRNFYRLNADIRHRGHYCHSGCMAGGVEIHVDGGIMSGQDVFRALALGAQGAYIGRAFLYALGAQGQQGVSDLLSIIATELDRTMAMCGERNVADIGRHNLVAFPAREAAA